MNTQYIFNETKIKTKKKRTIIKKKKKKKKKKNRNEGNDQESIQLPNIFRSRHQRVRRTHIKQQHHIHNTKNRKPKGQLLS